MTEQESTPDLDYPDVGTPDDIELPADQSSGARFDFDIAQQRKQEDLERLASQAAYLVKVLHTSVQDTIEVSQCTGAGPDHLAIVVHLDLEQAEALIERLDGPNHPYDFEVIHHAPTDGTGSL